MKLVSKRKIYGIDNGWHENGQLFIETPYRNGKRHGTHKEWYGHIQLEYKIKHRNEKKHGTFNIFL